VCGACSDESSDRGAQRASHLDQRPFPPDRHASGDRGPRRGGTSRRRAKGQLDAAERHGLHDIADVLRPPHPHA
jgi:hypothetical protein